MALDATFVGGTTGYKAEVTVDGNAKFTLPQVLSQAGFAALAAINHDGSSGAPILVRPAEISINRRLRVGMDSLMFQDCFNYSVQNTAIWQYVLTTMTVTHVGGFAVLNSGNSVASGAVARLQTYKYMPLFNGAGISIEMECLIAQAPQTNNVIEMGMFLATGTAAPTDGFGFRVTAGGAFQGFANYGGAEFTIALNGGVVPTTGVTHAFLMRIEQEEIGFWVDGALLGTLSTPAGQNGPSMSTQQPVTFRTYNTAVTSVAQQLKIGEIRTFLRDINVNRPWAQTMAGMGMMGAQGQGGNTMGSTALMANSALTAAAVPSNTAASLGSGLGGNFQHTNTLAVGTDGIISSYQVPVGTAAIPGRSLVITGIRIATGVTTTLANAAGAMYAWSLAFGHTAVSLATTEGAATKAPRRVPLGVQGAVGALVQGSQLQDVWMQFASPIVVNPGEFIQTVVKNVGTVGTAGVLLHMVTFDAHWE